MILDISKEHPTFHAFAGAKNGGTFDRTKCGRVISVHRVGIPMKHARKFAQECRGCFPPVPPQKETLF